MVPGGTGIGSGTTGGTGASPAGTMSFPVGWGCAPDGDVPCDNSSISLEFRSISLLKLSDLFASGYLEFMSLMIALALLIPSLIYPALASATTILVCFTYPSKDSASDLLLKLRSP